MSGAQGIKAIGIDRRRGEGGRRVVAIERQARECACVEPGGVLILVVEQSSRRDKPRDRNTCGRVGRRESCDGDCVDVVVGVGDLRTRRQVAQNSTVVDVCNHRSREISIADDGRCVGSPDQAANVVTSRHCRCGVWHQHAVGKGHSIATAAQRTAKLADQAADIVL